MEENRKFYVKPNWILDADIIGEVEYKPAGEPIPLLIDPGPTEEEIIPKVTKHSEIYIAFKNPDRDGIHLWDKEADCAWKNIRRVVGAMEDRAQEKANEKA